MSYPAPVRLSALAAFAVAGLFVASSDAMAQRDAGAKMRGEFGTGFWENQQSGRRSVRHATDYSRDLHDYSRHAQPVAPQVARKHSEEIGRNLANAKQNFGEMRKAAANRKEVLARLEAIDKYLANATKLHAELHEACMKDSVDTHKTMECCTGITAELEKAAAEHDKLLKLLTDDSPATPKAGASKSKK